MTDVRFLLIMLAFSVSALACGGDDDAPPSPPTAVAVEDFCMALVQAACVRADACGCATTAEQCAMAASARCAVELGTPARDEIESGTRAWDGDAAGRYLAALADAPCEERVCEAAQCIGLSAANGACDDELMGCQAGDSCFDGRCVTPAADGEPCAGAAGCLSGRCADGTCMPKAELGAACAEDSECATGNCDFATGGRCQPLIVDGELCTESADCESGYCDRDLKLGAGSCRALGLTGDACDEDLGCASGACTGMVCASPTCKGTP